MDGYKTVNSSNFQVTKKKNIRRVRTSKNFLVKKAAEALNARKNV